MSVQRLLSEAVLKCGRTHYAVTGKWPRLYDHHPVFFSLFTAARSHTIRLSDKDGQPECGYKLSYADAVRLADSIRVKTDVTGIIEVQVVTWEKALCLGAHRLNP